MIAGVARHDRAARERAQLQDLIVNFNTTAGAFAAAEGALRAGGGELGPTVTRPADAAFKSLDASFPATRGFARDFLPGVRETPATVEAAFPWIAQTRALLGRTSSAACSRAPAGDGGPRAAAGRVARVAAADRCVANRCFARRRSSRPANGVTATRLRPSVENYKEFWYTMVGLAGEGANFDGNGSYIRRTGGGSQTDLRQQATSARAPHRQRRRRRSATARSIPRKPPPYAGGPATAALPDVNGPAAREAARRSRRSADPAAPTPASDSESRPQPLGTRRTRRERDPQAPARLHRDRRA